MNKPVGGKFPFHNNRSAWLTITFNYNRIIIVIINNTNDKLTIIFNWDEGSGLEMKNVLISEQYNKNFRFLIIFLNFRDTRGSKNNKRGSRIWIPWVGFSKNNKRGEFISTRVIYLLPPAIGGGGSNIVNSRESVKISENREMNVRYKNRAFSMAEKTVEKTKFASHSVSVFRVEFNFSILAIHCRYQSLFC